MSTQEKLMWLTIDFIELLNGLSPDSTGKWGVMNAHQMVEHMSYSVRQANGKDKKILLTPSENLEKIRAFMLSEKPFRENTKNIELPEIPDPPLQPGMNAAIAELNKELTDFIEFYKLNPDVKFMNPFFGELNFNEWVHLLHKHAMHHARQFGLLE